MAVTETGAAAHERVDQTQIGVLYAGDIELARPQFASSARHLTLVPIADVIGAFGGRGVAAGIDVAVIDCAAPGVNAAQSVAQLRALRLSIPILLVIDPGIENGAAMALSLQTDDYTVKTPGWLGRLPTRLQLVVNRHRRLKQLENGGQIEQRLKTAVEKAPVCLARVLDDGSVAAMNDAARGMLAVGSLADVLKKPLAVFVGAGDHQPLSEFIATVCGGEPRSIELSILPKEGDGRIAELRGVALPPDSSGRSSAIITMRDLSDRRRLEASVVDVVAMGDHAAERLANEQLSAEVVGLRQRLADAEGQQQLLIEDRDAERHAAGVAATETVRLAALLAELESTADRGDLEQACLEARTAAEHATRALEEARREAAASAHHFTSELAQERLRRETVEQSLETNGQQLAAAVTAREAETARIIVLSQDREGLRSALEEQDRALSADREKHLDRIRELEQHLREQSGAHTHALEQECRARQAAESRLSELEPRLRDEAGAAGTLRGRIHELEQHLHEQSGAHTSALEQECRARQAAEGRLSELEPRLRGEAGAGEILRDRIRELEQHLQEQSGAHTSALEQECRARQAAESRLSELEPRLRNEAGAAGTLRERCDTLEAERQRLMAEVAAAERAKHLQGVNELERTLRDLTQASALEQERRAREGAESRLSELERRVNDETRTAGTLRERCDTLETERQRLVAGIEQAMQQYAAKMAAAHAALAQAVHDRDALRSTLDADRHRHQLAVAAAVTQISSDHEAVIQDHAVRVATLTTQLRHAEAACERLTAERDDHEKVFRAIEEERQQSADSRRGYRRELLAALTDAQRFEALAARHLDKSHELEGRLRAAKAEFDELTQWASARAARLAEGLS